MHNAPLVSIIIPVFNGSNYVREAIESALSQTYSNIEVIVVNDGSTDNGATENIILEYKDKITYIKKENGGVSSALNAGIRNMKGEYFSWLSHDDVYMPDKIEKQIETLKKYNVSNAVVKSFTRFIDKNSDHIDYMKANPYEKVLPWDDAVQYVTRKGINGCTLLIPKKVFSEVGLFDERLRYCQDTFMWWQIFLNEYSMIMCDHIGVSSRIHGNQLTRTGSKLYYHDSVLISDYLIPAFKSKSTVDRNLLFEYAKREAVYGNSDIVFKCIDEGKENSLINIREKTVLHILNLYGRVRPLIRNLYYRVKHGIRIK